MRERVLVTGGYGFIGRHVCSALLRLGYDVRVLDALIEQVHGASMLNPKWTNIEFVCGDIRDSDIVSRSLQRVSSVIHLAAEVGVGQSMYEIERYTSVNDLGTAVLLEAMATSGIRRLVVASSMSIYGEGLYADSAGAIVDDCIRVPGQGSWDPLDSHGTPLKPLPTPESKRPSLSSVYALNKFAQERMCQIVCEARGTECSTLRLFNVFGPGQALSNPYTGVLAIFASRLLNGEPPLVFEDGLQRRDFVHIDDVAAAFTAALERPAAAGEVLNIASGHVTDIASVARDLAAAMGKPHLEPRILQRARKGDIRHCFADITRARDVIGFEPRRHVDAQTLGELAEWVAQQQAPDRVEQARSELEARGLLT